MTDVHSPSQRSFNMSRIKLKNTRPEILVRKLIYRLGFRYRLHCKDLPGKPDIVFRKQKKVIFIHGCFWHRHDCRFFKWPETNEKFWRDKIDGNVHRDFRVYESLLHLGWRYLIVWECEIRESTEAVLAFKIKEFLEL